MYHPWERGMLVGLWWDWYKERDEEEYLDVGERIILQWL
jgi:hypothetical protein